MRRNDPFEELMRSLEETLRRGGEEEPPTGESRPVRTQAPEPPRIARGWLWLIGILLLLYLLSRGVGTVAQWTWMESVGFSAVFWTRLGVMAALFVGGALLFYLIFAVNVIVARQLAPFGLNDTPVQEVMRAFGMRVTPVVMLAGAAVALFMGMIALAQWENVLLFLNQGPFDIADPVFGRDVGFYVFTLPIWSAVRAWLLLALAVSFVAVLIVSGILWQGWRQSGRVVVHLALLGALMLLLAAWQYRIASYELLFNERGAFFGASFSDIRALLPGNSVMLFLSIAAAAALVVLALLRRGPVAMLSVVGVWFAVGLVATGVYPTLVQRFQVGPNELTLEEPYIAENIAYTRAAYALDEIGSESYDARQQLTGAALLQEPDTLRNIRLWDYRPLLQTYNQVQALRQYYEFNDIDIDRYGIGEQRRQVMLAARELVPDRLSADAQTWVNRKLVYTHGYGVAASPVAQVTRDGLPTFYLKDLPPTGVITVTVPQLYFGERTNDYVVGRTDRPEFDFPHEDGNVTTSFSAETGIPMTWWNRILFAVTLRDINLILNNDIRPDSRLLWQRNIVERVKQIAPFLEYDSDPYIVISDDGRLYWMHDAFTTSNRFPYSTPMGQLNYIRNAVKVVTNAYDGSMTFYIADVEDPIIAGYARVFPTLFRPLSEMPVDLLDNVRYPEDLFTVQAEVFRTYHMTDPVEFYNREDVWAWPEEIFEDETVRMDPYYVLMQLPGRNELDYVIILPYTPFNRENMVAWLAAQNDPDQYGEKVVYNFGKDSLFFGPKQVEARINQDPVISQQLTLWNQQGSGVIRGNLLVVPIGSSLLYVEPIYLRAATGRIPELARVIVATADNVIMAENLGAALINLFGPTLATDAAVLELGGRRTDGALVGAEAGTAGTEDEAEVVGIEELIARANEVFVTAQERQQEGDWAGYGEAIDELESVLQRLAEAGGVLLPTPTLVPLPVDVTGDTAQTELEPAETPAP